MSKSHKKKGFKYSVQNELPPLKKIQLEWDMKKLYYKSDTDPQIEEDLKTTEKAYADFVKKFRSSNFTKDAKTLLKALKYLDSIAQNPATRRPARYFSLCTTLDARDVSKQKKLNLIGDRLTKASNELLFFGLELGKVSKQQQKKFLTDPLLSEYTYYLKRMFLESKHDLSEAEERILRLYSGPSFDMWVEATERMLANRTITYKGKTIGFSEAVESLEELPSKEKPKVWKLLSNEMEQLSEFVEQEFTAIITGKKISDELRGFEKPYSATTLSYEDNEKSIEALVAAVSTKGFKLSRKFYELKAKLHGVKQLDYSQKYDSLASDPHIPFEQSVEIARDVFYGLKHEYGAIFDGMLTNGQIDVFPKKGKRGGAFMSEEVAQPTQVFLNHTSTLKDLETLAHEMGHAIHAERAKVQLVQYQGFSTTTAETASTLFENLVFDRLLEQVDEKDKLELLHHKLTRDIATIQRQISFFNFEFDIHTHVRKEGAITKEELNAYMRENLSAYLGKGVSVTETDGHSYVYVPHFRYGFYVYTYTFGILMSSMMAEAYAQDKKYIEKIDTFFTLGASDDVHSIFKKVGFDTNSEKTFASGLDSFARRLSDFEKLTKKGY